MTEVKGRWPRCSAVDHIFICYDEKIFTVEAVTNTLNDKLYAVDADLLEGSHTRLRCMKPAAVKVWAAVTSVGFKSSLVFIEKGVKVNTQVYIKILTKNVIL